MAIWVLFALLTGAAVLAVLRPLSRRCHGPSTGPDERAFYLAQIGEIDCDGARGLIGPADAQAAKAEAGRRLVRAAGRPERQLDFESEPALRRRRAASAVVLSIVPLLALALYGKLGSPDAPAQPLAARLDQDPAKLDFAQMVARIEAHLANYADDGRGWEVIAPVYLKLDRAGDAVKAYEASLRLNGESAARLADYGEALVAEAEGIVERPARQAFERALSLDRGVAKARFYLAIAAEQDGDTPAAIARLKDLAAAAPADAPWRGAVEEHLARLGVTTTASVAAAPVAALPQAQQTAIAARVEGLAARLEADGSDAEGWLRLVRSYAVLGKPDRAATALGAARRALAGRPADIDKLAALARELKLGEDGGGQ